MADIELSVVLRNVQAILEAKKVSPSDLVDTIWNDAIDSPAKTRPYFLQLGLTTVPDRIFRYHANPLRGRLDVGLGAIVAPLKDSQTNDLIGVRLLYLSQSGRFKSSLIRPQTIAREEGGVIQLARPVKTLAICESLESALAFMEHRRVPTWCTLTAKGTSDFVPPKGVTEVIRVEGPDQGRLNAKGSARHCTTYPCLSVSDLPISVVRKRRVRKPNATVSQSIAMGVPS